MIQTSTRSVSSKFGLRTFARDERGMSTVEYIILLAVIVVGAVAVWKEIGGKVGEELGAARDSLNQL
jgi:Flp pilus assembly pilin Flp